MTTNHNTQANQKAKAIQRELRKEYTLNCHVKDCKDHDEANYFGDGFCYTCLGPYCQPDYCRVMYGPWTPTGQDHIGKIERTEDNCPESCGTYREHFAHLEPLRQAYDKAHRIEARQNRDRTIRNKAIAWAKKADTHYFATTHDGLVDNEPKLNDDDTAAIALYA